MSGLKIFISNRMEVLIRDMAGTLKTPVSSPLVKEAVVVQSKGMERWISLELARFRGVCANMNFFFPKDFVREMFKKIVADLPANSPFDPGTMTWEIMKLLPSLLTKKGFETVADYLSEDNHLKRFQLSGLIADTFDQYTIFRPDMLLQWESGEEDHWQARLWRELVKGKEPVHNASLWEAFRNKISRNTLRPIKSIKKIAGGDFNNLDLPLFASIAREEKSKDPPRDFHNSSANLPERISVFGISALPPFHIDILIAVSQWIEVNFFLLNPCKEFWSDIVSEKEMNRFTKKNLGNLSPDKLYLTKGNSLLASMGIYGRDFFNMIQQHEAEEFESFPEPVEDSMLGCLQSDILKLRERGIDNFEKTSAAEKDRSIQVHSCHSPLREVEVLHDNLLSIFQEDPGVAAGDVLVMTPDIGIYSPFIHAVFGAAIEGGPRIPYSISDQNQGKISKVIDTFLAILDLPESRFGAVRIIETLESYPLRRKFGFSESDMETVKVWIEKTGIRWGIDEDYRKNLDLSGFPENTWKAGLERLLLGYAMSGEGEKLYEGILPSDAVEGADTTILGKLMEFVDQLFHYAGLFKRERTLEQWAETLEGMLENFFVVDEDTERDIQLVQGLLFELRKNREITGFTETVDLAVIKSFLTKRLLKETSWFGFLTGKVTFCAMLPMRSVPFKVICLIGMDNDAFPRTTRSHGFDLMAKSPRPGDRSLGKEDRYIFLEALISARKFFYMSYVGQNIKDNSESPPSILVNELLDYLEQGFEFSTGATISEHVVTKHKLQPFSREYFKEKGPLFSYSAENFDAAESLGKKPGQHAPFITKGLSSPSDDWKTLSISRLCKFFTNPAKFLLKDRLGIFLEERAVDISETEPFSLEGLDKYTILQDLVEKRLEGQNPEDLFNWVKASGALPHGKVGEWEYEKAREKVESFVPRVEIFKSDSLARYFTIDREVFGFRIMGRVGNISGSGFLNYRLTSIKPKDRLRAWINHLAVNLFLPEDISKTTVFIGEDAILKFPPIDNGMEYFERLLQGYWEGLSNPLRFFPASSWAYAESILRKKKSEDVAMAGAKKEWFGSDFHTLSEKYDPYFDLCFGKIDPLDTAFSKWALEIFEPIINLGEEEK